MSQGASNPALSPLLNLESRVLVDIYVDKFLFYIEVILAHLSCTFYGLDVRLFLYLLYSKLLIYMDINLLLLSFFSLCLLFFHSLFHFWRQKTRDNYFLLID